MYSFANREDTAVLDEPFYGYYLKSTGVEHPGHQEIITSMECDWNRVVNSINTAAEHDDLVFVKNMAHHLLEEDLDFLKNWTNVLLIRDPKQLIASFHQVIPNPTMKDIGSKKQWELFRVLGAPVVIDSNELLKDPEKILRSLCERIGIPFSARMLSWPSGPISTDGIWAEYWYKNVHASSGFEKQKTSNRPLPESCIPLYEEAIIYYNELFQNALKA